MKNKKVYIAISSDIVNPGIINIIKKARELGDITLGLLTDEAITTYKKMPILTYKERKEIYNNIKGITNIIPQKTLDYTENLELLKPDYVVHGDDWQTGLQKQIREKVINTLKKWNGQLIEIPYNTIDTEKALTEAYKEKINTPEYRRAMLKKLLKQKPYLSVLEASNGLTGLIVENTKIIDEKNNQIKEFDAMWVSSLCDSTFKGKPDIELVDLTSRINTINEIMEVTTKPIILDGDTGGKKEHFAYTVKTLERLGVSAIIIEDKKGLKKNSLFGTEVTQTMEEPFEFAEKIKTGKKAQATRDFMIFARIESLIAGETIEKALERAYIYINAGVDGIMIHSKEKDGKEIFEFLEKFRKEYKEIPVILVPTTYNQFTEKELNEKGANIIIHANHQLRSAYKAMQKTAQTILEDGNSKRASEQYCTPIKDILTLIPGGK